MNRLPILLLLGILVAGCSGSARKADGVAGSTGYPEGYTGWRKLNRDPIVMEGDRTARHLFANEIALHGDQGSPAFPVGSILVKQEHTLDADTGLPAEAFRVSVMAKVDGAGGPRWVFKAYDPDSRREFPPDRVDPEGCYFCHVDAADRDYVFTSIRGAAR
jgi:hypothetical protein